MSTLLRYLAGLQLDAIGILRDVATVEGFGRRVEAMGYDVSIDDQLMSTAALGQEVFDSVDALAADLVFGAPAPDDIPGLVSQVTDLIETIRTYWDDIDQSGLTSPFDSAQFWEEFGVYIAEEILREMLARNAPALKLVLSAIGVIKVEDIADAASDRFGTIETFDFDAISDFLADPDGVLAAKFGRNSDFWTGPEVPFFSRALIDLGLSLDVKFLTADEAAAIDSMTAAAGDACYRIRLIDGVLQGTMTPMEAGLNVLPKPALTQGAVGLGLYASPFLQGGSFDLSPAWTLEFGIDTDETILCALTSTGLQKENFTGTLSTTLKNVDPQPILLLGEDGGTRLDLQNFEIEAALVLEDSDSLEAQLCLSLEQLGVHVVPGDNFLAEILGDGFSTALDLDIMWSSASGVTFAGSAGFQYTVPTEISLGPIALTDLTLAISAEGGAPTAQATTGVLGDFGPFDVRIGDMGLSLNFDMAPGNKGLIGPFNLSAGVVPPSEFALSLSLPAVSGGGLIDIDGTRYSGALMLDVIEVGIAAITVIETALPDDPDGFAFFAALTLGVPAIPLGFGFSLSGVGGLIAINRGVDSNAIAGALKDGVIDALLFPDDPINDAPQLIAMIDNYFPVLQGNTIVGPIVEIGWGAPINIISAQLGVIISIPEGKIALLGSISAKLPLPAAPLLVLNMDLIGEVDLPGGTMFMAASLYDSTLLGTISLSGDMGMFLSAKGQPYFLLSVGGYHPGFEPPSLVPSSLHNLARMRASVNIGSNVEITITTYFAVTSNTVQYGASVTLIMSTKVALTTYEARGAFSFDILLQFNPFAIIADIAAAVGVYSGDKELMGVYLAAHLEGPKPWFASGTAEFKFFGIKVKFNVEVGSKAPDEPKERIALRADILAALSAKESWKETPPKTALLAGLTFVDLNADPELDADRIWIRPDHSVAVSQGIAPLNRKIEIVGTGLPAAGDEMFNIDSASIGALGSEFEKVLDYFAPAQFEDLTRADKLARASFEEMPAGVSFGASDAVVTAHPDTLATTSRAGYEEKWWEDADDTDIRTINKGSGPGALGLSAGSAAQALGQTTARATPTYAVAPVAYVIVDEITGVSDAGLADGAAAGSQRAAMDASAGLSGKRVVSAANLSMGAL